MDNLADIIKMAKINRVIMKPDDIILFDAADIVLSGQDPYGVASRHILEMNQEIGLDRSRTPNMGFKDGFAPRSRIVEKWKR